MDELADRPARPLARRRDPGPLRLYVAERRQRKDAAGTVTGTLEESVTRAAAAAIIELASYGEPLSADRYRDGFTPWNGRSSSQVAGMRPPAENKTPAVEPGDPPAGAGRSALPTATIAPRLVALPPQVRQRRWSDAQLEGGRPRPGRWGRRSAVTPRAGEPLEAVRDATSRARLQPGMGALTTRS